MGWTINNLILRESLEIILEQISDICITNGEVLGSINGNKRTECRFCKEWIGGLVKVNSFHLKYNII